MNPSSEKRGKIVIIPASPDDSNERECSSFELDLCRRIKRRKFLVLRKERKKPEVRRFMTKAETSNISKNDLNSSSKVSYNQSEKLKVNSLHLSSVSHSPEVPINGNSPISDICEEAYDGESSKCSQKEATRNNSSLIFYPKRNICPKFDYVISQNIKKTYSRTDKLQQMDSSQRKGLHFGLLNEILAIPLDEIYNCTAGALELRRCFYTFARKLKFCETDENKCFIIIKIALHCMKGPFRCLCKRIIPKLVLMIEEMSRNVESKMCCSVALLALIKMGLVLNYSDISAIITSLVKTNIVSSCERQQETKSNLKIQNHIFPILLEEKENFEIMMQYTACDFAIDSILAFSSYARTDVFKDELRRTGGLDIILDIVNSQTVIIWKKQSPLKIQQYNVVKLEHCLSILENVIFKNPENQSYVLHYKNFQLMQNISSVLQFIHSKFTPRFDQTSAVESTKCLSSCLKLLMNITYKNVEGSICVEKESDILPVILFFIVSLPRSIQEIDITLLLLGLTANLVMTSKVMLHRFATLKAKCFGFKNEVNFTVALSKVFCNLYLEAKELEGNTEKLLNVNASQACEKVISSVLCSASHHMKYTMALSLLAVVVGYAIKDNKDHAYTIKNSLPDVQFGDMGTVLKEFHDFVNITGLLENVDMEEILKIANVLLEL